MKPVTVAAAVAASALLLGGCSGAPAAQSPSAGAASSTPATVAPTQFLAAHGLEGKSAKEIVDMLDASEEDRENGPMGSVRPAELVLSDSTSEQKTTLPMPEDSFYLAMAPYTERTHQCFNHNTATCKGELAGGDTFHATLVDSSGKTVVDQDVTTYDNGFGSLWVPRHLTGTLTITHQGKKVTVPVSTEDDAPTCLTTPLKLV